MNQDVCVYRDVQKLGTQSFSIHSLRLRMKLLSDGMLFILQEYSYDTSFK